jgi:putative ABC transport system permease protein
VKNPGFAIVAVLALALGIGANTAIFTVVDAVVLRPLPYDDPERLVFLWERNPRLDLMSISWPNFADWRSRNRSFEQLAARQPVCCNLTGSDEPERLLGLNVTADLWPMLRARPLHGRVFTHQDDRPGAAATVVISHGLWQRRFSSDPRIVGRQITLNDKPHQVIGIMPAAFRFPPANDRNELWLPLGRNADRLKDRGNHPGIYAIGRLKPGVSLDAAAAEMNVIAAQLEREHPDSNRDQTVGMDLLHTRMVQTLRPAMFVVLGAVAFVLLIACANVGNLLLTRSAARSHEIAVRTAVGAGRWDLVRQLLTESLLLAAIGGVAGVLLAVWGVEALTALLPADTPRIDTVAIDIRVLFFSLGITALTGLIFGLFPAVQVARSSLGESIREGRRTGSSVHRQRMRSSLVVAELALAHAPRRRRAHAAELLSPDDNLAGHRYAQYSDRHARSPAVVAV